MRTLGRHRLGQKPLNRLGVDLVVCVGETGDEIVADTAAVVEVVLISQPITNTQHADEIKRVRREVDKLCRVGRSIEVHASNLHGEREQKVNPAIIFLKNWTSFEVRTQTTLSDSSLKNFAHLVVNLQ